ncbi:hypothetical protein [Chitinophaga sp. CF418]|uniref:hypothetical protein n=1 Tax=Chitinophaga sp. CF418 TaxID=1855287 RepID=UPI00091FFB49|nr:hypothetical protein [Chitinophaga sp. CF418]SHN40836.1 hypothetical protein SAMN05216311_112118 [Chitinophaga sp. CF418]
MIQIDELLIRMPGLNEEEGRRLAEMVAEYLGAHLPEGISEQHISTLNVQMQLHSKMERDAMSVAIAEQILQQLKVTIR